MDIGEKVINSEGNLGEIVDVENLESINIRYGVLHDKPNLDYNNGIMYYKANELERCCPECSSVNIQDLWNKMICNECGCEWRVG